MHAAKRRLSQLERKLNNVGEGLLVVIKAGPDETEVDEILRANDIDMKDPKHQIVVLRTVYERKDGSIDPSGPRAELLYTMPRGKH